MARAAAWHFLAWSLGAAEVWAILAVLGVPVGPAEAYAIESLGMAARSLGFVLPAGLGAQEAGLAAVAVALGVPLEEAVAMSMLKRLREVLMNLPGVIAWRSIANLAVSGRGDRTRPSWNGWHPVSPTGWNAPIRQDHVRTPYRWLLRRSTSLARSPAPASRCTPPPPAAVGSSTATKARTARAVRDVLALTGLVLGCTACSLVGDPAAHPRRGLAPPPPGLSGPPPPASYVPGPRAVSASAHGTR
ncbi:lysylphosphatidylglycerol synthase domain-containing protein [Siccirubricoccus sp. G192]|uniref:lysylphosphatidylglycerol synthase domain-containing protein n=1 Tax=Siccirubricoccus sp. G192 TaxID=2849651 RepID=UPI001C2C7A13|nr:lysylphosphatidylglycerol synthase domain-containing protein [Siccirubricoccus sp. G192]MBV1798938.1 flippase-like domain-containing protein [Siccirubricoccus sp. G192]